MALFFLAACPLGVHTANLDECAKRLRATHAAAAALNVTDSPGPPPPLNLTYEQCLAKCGGGLGNISWEVFTQSISAWFLPWIVLMFQIPFGAECKPFTPTPCHLP